MPQNTHNPDTTAAPGPDRRARQRERRRAELYETALELFIEKTFEGTTMEDIAERADVARATVFNYFPRKVAFLEEWATRRRELAIEAAYSEDATESSLRDVLVRYFTTMAALTESSPAESAAVILGAVHSTDIWRRSPLASEFGRVIAQAQEKGEIERSLDADRIGLFLSSSYYVILTAWASESPAPFDLTEELVGTVDILLGGILPRTGPAR